MSKLPLDLNYSEEDKHLYSDSASSYFQYPGYKRTTNYSIEIRDIPSKTSEPSFGSKLTFTIPKVGDLLHATDLIIDLLPATDVPRLTTKNKGIHFSWVNELGYAAIETATLTIGNNIIETLTGEQLQLMSCLTNNPYNAPANAVLKTATTGAGMLNEGVTSSPFSNASLDTYNSKYTRFIGVGGRFTTGTEGSAGYKDEPVVRLNNYGHKLIVPLAFFFTRHISEALPFKAIHGTNDVQISITLRPLASLIQVTHDVAAADVAFGNNKLTFQGSTTNPIANCYIRCHMVHLTRREAALFEEATVRLFPMWQRHIEKLSGVATTTAKKQTLVIKDMGFRGPVSHLLVTIRWADVLNNLKLTPDSKDDLATAAKGFFNYLGYNEIGPRDPDSQARGLGTYPVCNVRSIKLIVNGQDVHPSLASKGLDADYMQQRMMSMLYPHLGAQWRDTAYASQSEYEQTAAGSATARFSLNTAGFAYLFERPDVFCIPFALNPAGANPSGSINLTNAPQFQLHIDYDFGSNLNNVNVAFQIDVHAVTHNWVEFHNGRVKRSFA